MKNLKYLFLITIVTFFSSAPFVDADSIYMEFKDGSNSTICGTSTSDLDCTYSYTSNGNVLQKVVDAYVIILEDLNLKANTTYTINMHWLLRTFALDERNDNYITTYNYKNFSSSIQPRYLTGSGTIIPDNNRTWRVVSNFLEAEDDRYYANYNYSYSNTFTPTSNINRLVFRISKRSQWQSMGSPPSVEQITNNPYTISIKNLEYIISSDNSDAIITNQNQNTNDIINSQNQNTDKITDSIDNLNDNITNDDVNGVENAFENFEGFVSENSTITQLLIMPITLYTSILNGLQSTCRPFTLGNLFGTDLTLPCINIGNYLGSFLWSMIDIIISGFAVYAISKKLIKIFNNFSSMKEGDVIDD